MKDRIKAVRKEIKLTQSEFGEKIGVKGNTITGYETGIRTPSDAVITSICREFNINEDWIRTGNGEMHITLSDDEQIANFIGKVLKSRDESFKKRYIKMLSALDDDGWEALEIVATTMQQLKKD